jgi:hypothetical protein
MMQAFLYRHLVPTQELDVSVSARFRGGAGARAGAIRILGFTPVQIPSGGTARVRVGIPARLLDRVELELNDPPDGITIRRVVPGLIGCEIVLQSDATKVKPGLSGNLIVNLFAKIALPAAVTPTPTSPTPTPTTTPAAKAKNNRVKVPIGVLPAIPFDVVGTVAARQALL